ncbi:MAG: extracellular solute-binding protein [Anaerolineae bacterium]
MRQLHRVVRIAVITLLALLLVLPQVACQPASKASATIRFVYASPFTGVKSVDQEVVNRFKSLAASFHETNPQYKVELVPITWEQLPGITAKDFDVLLFQSFYFSPYLERGILRSLAGWLSLEDKAWSGDYRPTVLKPFERNGELWAVPWALDPEILYYNRDLFTRFGIEAPRDGWTWSDFLEKASALTDSENNSYGSMIVNMYGLVEPVIYQHGGRLFDDWNQPTVATLDDPRNAEALSWLASLIYEYKVMPTQAQATRLFGTGVFNLSRGAAKGTIGMWAGQYIERGGANLGPEMAWKVSWGAAPLPRDAQAATIAIAYELGISSQAADADASWQWLSFLSQQAPPDLLLPARTSVRQALHADDASQQEAIRAGSAALEGLILISTEQSTLYVKTLGAFNTAVERVLYLGKSAADELQAAQQKATQ